MSIYDEKTEEILFNIKQKILDITSGERGMPVYLKGVVFPENNSRGASHCIINASCIFINEDSNVCADLFRTDAAGFMECSSGSIICSLGRKGLEEILTALNGEKWYISETPENGRLTGKKINILKKRVPGISFKFSFHLKG